jgi:hypothetical protein
MEALGKPVSSSRSRYLVGVRMKGGLGAVDALLPECDCLECVSWVSCNRGGRTYIIREPVVLDAVDIFP